MMQPALLSLLLLAASFGACSAQKSDPDVIKPTKRYTAYESISTSVKNSAISLGYSTSSWNSFTESIEGLAYSSIAAGKLDDVDNLLTGSSVTQFEPSWDCWLNHYSEYFWFELADEGVQVFYIALGWNEDFWDNGSGEPASEDKDWSELTGAERTAAKEVCFLELTWDGGSLVAASTPSPTTPNPVTPSPTPPKGGGCFSSVNQVEVLNKGFVSVASLEIGDNVLAGKGRFSRVYSLSHADHTVEMEYLQIRVHGLKKALEVSAEHLVSANGKMTRASDLKLGDLLLSADENETFPVVDEIRTVKRLGAYAPITEAGHIVVNGVLSSCYIAILDHAPFDQHYATHAFFAPVRFLCAVNFGICERETYTEGYSYWIYYAMLIVEALNTCSAPVQAVVSVACLLVFATVDGAVQLLLSPLHLGLVVIGGTYFFGLVNRRARMHTKTL